MKNIILVIQIALIFIGSIVGAGVCSGRELNQFFSVYGIGGILGIILCGVLYVIFGIIIVAITDKYKMSSYNEFVDLVCPKVIAKFTNIVLTLFLFSSTSIILAGSGSIISQYFNLPRYVGTLIMIGLSVVFLMRKTDGLFEVNSFVVPLLMIVMCAIFIKYIGAHPDTMNMDNLRLIPRQKTNLLSSTLIYVSFNILTIIGVIVPLTYELKKKKQIIGGIVLGSVILTIIGSMIAFLMLVNPFYPELYEIPMLGLAMQMSKVLQIAMLGIMWLEMFSSQVSNVYSLSYFLGNRYNMKYGKSVGLIILVAMPFSLIGFADLIELLYPMYGVLSLVFLFYCTWFFVKDYFHK